MRDLGKWQPDAVAGWHNVLIADLDGDGKDDIVGQKANGDWNWIYQVGSSDVFLRIGNWSPADNYKSVFAGDLNRDGRDELFGRRGTDGVWRVDKNVGSLVRLTDPNLQPDWDESVDWMFATLGEDDGNLF